VVFIFFAMQLSKYSTLICVVVSMHMLESRASNSTTIIKSISNARTPNISTSNIFVLDYSQKFKSPKKTYPTATVP
jgi:hypothetical protein